MDMMQIRRKMMGVIASTHRGLPAEYLAVEYLESTGAQYIDTGIDAQPGMQAKYKIVFTKNDVIQQVCAEFVASSVNKIYFPYADNTSWKFCYGLTVIEIPNISVSTNTVYEVDAAFRVGSVSIKINNNEAYTGTSSVQTMPNTRSLYLFASNNISASNRREAYARIYSFELIDTQSNIKLADYVPCIRKSDGKPGMYDTVGGTFYTNAGTGEFSIPT